VPAPTDHRPHAAHAGAAKPQAAPLWAILAVTWVNSLGSGILWSGIPFVTADQYGFSERQNLALAIAESVIYVVVALASGRLVRWMGARFGLTPRGWLATVFALQAAGSLLALAGLPGVIAAACIISAIGAALWPVMESYVSSGRHGGAMRRALGSFNVTWMSATGAALLVMAPLMTFAQPGLVLLALLPVSLASIALLRWFPAAPAPHAHADAHTHVAPSYPHLLRATRFIIPVSYVFISVLGPLLPYILRDLDLSPGLQTTLASTWMFVRMGTVVLLALASFWHGRWGALVLGVTLLAGGFAAIVLAPSVPVVVAGLACFGAGHGILYYASLYYAMAVGSADVDAGGTFEALIGVGYVIGPVAGMAAGGAQAGLVGAVWAVAAAGALPAVGAWLRWSRVRGSVPAPHGHRAHAAHPSDQP
jgi:hypothetical protein